MLRTLTCPSAKRVLTNFILVPSRQTPKAVHRVVGRGLRASILQESSETGRGLVPSRVTHASKASGSKPAKRPYVREYWLPNSSPTSTFGLFFTTSKPLFLSGVISPQTCGNTVKMTVIHLLTLQANFISEPPELWYRV